MPTFAVILAAAGQSSRFGDKHYKKPFAPLANKPVWLYSAERFINRSEVAQTILVVAPEDRTAFGDKFLGSAAMLGIEIVDGGAERADSVQRALERVRKDIDFVAVHDAARPCLAEAWIDEVFAAAQKNGAAILAQPIRGTIKRGSIDKNQAYATITETIPRDGLWEAQTPQVMRRDWLVEAYAKRGGFNATDEAQLLERAGKSVALVPGSPINLKITTKEDMRLAEHALKALPQPKLGNALNPFADDDQWR